MNFTEVECFKCKKKFQRSLSLYNSQLNKNRNQFCSKKCSMTVASEKAIKITTIPFSYNLANAFKNSKRKNIEFSLTLNILNNVYIKQNKKCAITGIEMKIRKRNEKKNLFHASIDRIDNEKGYSEDNIQFVLLGINYMRNTLDLESVYEFLNCIKKS